MIIPGLPQRRAGNTWTRIRNPARYSHRDSTRIFEHSGLLYMSNGYQPGGVLARDLWKSADGIEWELVNSNTPYLGWCPMVSFNGEIVALGSSILRSADNGVTFTVALASPPFTMPDNTRGTWWPIVRGSTLILIGQDRTWWTTNLTTWQSRTMPFYRENFALYDMNGTVFVAAGNNRTASAEVGYPDNTSFNDVWSAPDPIAGTWTRITSSAPWAKRMWPSFAVHDGELIISGGFNNVTGATNFADTWASHDGISWREVGSSVRYPPRHYSQLVSRYGRLILNNGNENPNVSPGTRSDVWELT